MAGTMAAAAMNPLTRKVLDQVWIYISRGALGSWL